MAFYTPSGASEKYKPLDARRDTRPLSTKVKDALYSQEGGMYMLFGITSAVVLTSPLPFAGEIVLGASILVLNTFSHPLKRLYNFPWRVPKHAKLFDGSKNLELLNSLNKGNAIKYKPESLYGEGVTYYGVDRDTGLQVYATNSDDRTHLTCLGTTGSGKTEFLLGLFANQLVQNSGLIYLDAKGDPAFQRDACRLTRLFGRDDDLLTINFITSGVDLTKPQSIKQTNTFNLMSNTSSGMLIELLNNLLDDSGGSGGDMWKGRAVAFIASLTQVLTYLRDRGVLQLSPSTYIEYLDLYALEELVYEHGGKYGESFEKVSLGLRSFIETIPGYNTSPKARKKQEQKTIEQFGFITMQLTRAINDLTFNYGYVFGPRQGDIDIFDCVLNRRILTIPLPALERSADSLKMLGKLCIGSIKQMMAGSLGNRIEGLVREILDSRPTNSPNAYRLIFDEFGYIVIPGVSVMPAQGRSLSFAICFAAQDFSDIKRGDANEAEAIWANSNVKAIGKINSGDNGDTMNKVNGMTGEMEQVQITSTSLKVGSIFSKYIPSTDAQYQMRKKLPYDDLHGQQEGEFTFLFSKKNDGGRTAGGKVVRVNTFYVASEPLSHLRLNDLAPNFSIEKERLINPVERIKHVKKRIINSEVIGSKATELSNILEAMQKMRTGENYKGNETTKIKNFLISQLSLISDAMHFQSPAKSEQTYLADAINSAVKVADQAQVDENSSIEIMEILKSSPSGNSAGNTSMGKPIALDKNIKVDIQEQSDISILEMLCLFQKSDDFGARLKEYNISIDDSFSSFNLLPYVPSHHIPSTVVDELKTDKSNNLEPVQSANISNNTKKKASNLFSLLSGDLNGELDEEMKRSSQPKLSITSQLSETKINDATYNIEQRDKVISLLSIVDRIKQKISID